MKIMIKEKNINPLLGRTEISGELDYEGATPSNARLAEHLAKEFNADISLIVVKYIYTKFSQQMADFLAFVYDNKEAKDKVEMITKHMKKEEEAGKKAEEAKKAEEEAKAAEAEKAVPEKEEENTEKEEKKEENESKEEKKDSIPTAEDLVKETKERFAGEDKEKEEKKKKEDEEGEQ